MMTMSPARNSGTKTFPKWASKASRLMGPSSTNGVIMRRSAVRATNVEVVKSHVADRFAGAGRARLSAVPARPRGTVP